MRLRLLATGVISLLGQVILLRELNVAFYGTELIYILALAGWMLWTAFGAALGRRASVPAPARVRGLLLVLAWVLPLSVVLIRGIRSLLGGVTGAYLPFPVQLAAMALALLPVGLLLGLLFQWAAKLYVGGGRTLAGAYATESVGTVVGGLLATTSLHWGLPNFAAAVLAGLLALAASFVSGAAGSAGDESGPTAAEGARSASSRRSRTGRPYLVAAAATGLILAGALTTSADLDRILTSLNHPDLAATADSPYGRITVTERGGQVSVFENDVLAFESEGTAAEEFVHLAAVQRDGPESVLVLGGGLEGLVEEMLRERPVLIDQVELNRVLMELVAAHLPEARVRALGDPSVRVFVADPRRFLDRAGVYDLILVGMPEPSSGQTNRFYTEEFFRQCRSHLSPDGVVALRLRGAENLWTPQFARRTASIHGALAAVFDDVVILPGTTQLMFASPRPLVRDPDVLSGRLVERGIEGRLVIPAYVDYLYRNDRFLEIPGRLAAVEAPVNRDARPICYQLTLLVWLSKFFPVVAVLELPHWDLADVAASPPVWIALALGLAILAWGRRRESSRRALLAGGAGFAGMVLETALILNYQTLRGVLYQDLGVLLTAFMAGLAAGAGVMDRRYRGSARGAPGRAAGAALVGGLALVSLVAAGLVDAGAVRGLAVTSLLLAVDGFLVAAVFAYASLFRSPDQRRVISPLYASDLAGGSLGALAASLVLIPAAGMAGAGIAAALGALAVIVLV